MGKTMHMTSKEKLNMMVKRSIAPCLKSAGFKKRSFTWNAHHSGVVHVVTLQKSSFYDCQVIFRYGIHLPEVARAYWRSESKDFVSESSCNIRRELEWVNIDEDTDMDSMGLRSQTMIRRSILPFFNELNTSERIHCHVLENLDHGVDVFSYPQNLIHYLALSKETERAQKAFDEECRRVMKGSVSTISVQRNGAWVTEKTLGPPNQHVLDALSKISTTYDIKMTITQQDNTGQA